MASRRAILEAAQGIVASDSDASGKVEALKQALEACRKPLLLTVFEAYTEPTNAEHGIGTQWTIAIRQASKAF